MAGAFVAVADDGSAVRWNPAGLASGPFFNLMLERSSRRREPESLDLGPAIDQSVTGFAITTLPLGLSYYRHRATTAGGAAPPDGPDPNSPESPMRASSLVTHHTGVTVLQSLTPALVVGATLKFVRGLASTATLEARSPDEALDRAADLIGQATNRFDADLGVMFRAGPLRAGLTVRNATAPSFETPSGEELPLERHSRAGLAWMGSATTVALDIDLTRSSIESGQRQVAVGLEQRAFSRAAFRGGVRFATGADRDPVLALGASVAVRSGIWIDGFWNGGEDDDRTWGVAARLAY
jgi:hypothetical protein